MDHNTPDFRYKLDVLGLFEVSIFFIDD